MQIQTIENPKEYADYRGDMVTLGSTVTSIECGWSGRVIAVEQHGDDVMLRCRYESMGKGEDDDVQWYSPNDVVRVNLKLAMPAIWCAMKGGDGWIETYPALFTEMLNVLPPERWVSGAFLVGEPYSENDKGEAIYAAFWRRDGRYFARYMSVREFDEQFA